MSAIGDRAARRSAVPRASKVPPRPSSVAPRASEPAPRASEPPERNSALPEERPADLWAVGGGKGGVGKSMIAANLALAVARRGRRVLLIDADLGGANQHTIFGLTRPRATLQDFLCGRVARLEDVAMSTRYRGLALVSGKCDVLGSANPKHSQKLKLLRHLIAAPADVVLLDLGAGTSLNTLDLFLAARVQLVVTTTEPTSLQNAYGFVKCAAQRSTDEIDTSEGFDPRIVFNCSTEAQADKLHGAFVGVTEKFLGRRALLAGAVRSDPSVHAAIVEGTPLYALAPSSAASRDIDHLADVLLPEWLASPPVAIDASRGKRAAHGLNEDLRTSGKLFHVQTEDLGPDKEQVRTQVFQAGRVIFTKVTPHGASLKKGVEMTRDEHIAFQHRAVIKAIQSGRLS